MTDTIDKGPSYWSGIPQDKLNQNNRDHIDLLCDAFGQGAYNLRVNWEKTNFGDLHSVFNIAPYGGEMATPDGDSLTRLVLGAHDRCIRVSISAHTFKQITIMMHSGRGRTGGVGSRHRTMEQALGYWRKYHPAEPGEITDQALPKRAVRNARKAALKEAIKAISAAREKVIHSGVVAYVDGVNKGHERAEQAVSALLAEMEASA